MLRPQAGTSQPLCARRLRARVLSGVGSPRVGAESVFRHIDDYASSHLSRVIIVHPAERNIASLPQAGLAHRAGVITLNLMEFTHIHSLDFVTFAFGLTSK